MNEKQLRKFEEIKSRFDARIKKRERNVKQGLISAKSKTKLPSSLDDLGNLISLIEKINEKTHE